MPDLGHILIADDEKTFLYSTADLLRKEGYECDCVLNSVSVVEKLETNKYDLLITDINMPGNPELELVKELPKIADGLPVILVTGNPSINSAIQSVQLNVVAYIVKPLDFEKLLPQVKISIENSRTYRTICGTRRRLQEWIQDLSNIEKLMKDTSGDHSSLSINTFFALTLRNIVDVLLDMKRLTEDLAVQSGKEHKLLESPRLSALSDGLLETIDVLERTKKAFKSKDLGKLREKLETLIKKIKA